MSQKNFLQLLGCLLVIKAVFLFIYMLEAWQLTIGTWSMPFWFAPLGAVLDIYFAYLAFTYSSTKKRK